MPSAQMIGLLIVAGGTVAGVHFLWPIRPAIAPPQPSPVQPEKEALVRRLEQLHEQINVAETTLAALVENNDAVALANRELEIEHAQLQADIERLKEGRRALDGFS